MPSLCSNSEATVVGKVETPDADAIVKSGGGRSGSQESGCARPRATVGGQKFRATNVSLPLIRPLYQTPLTRSTGLLTRVFSINFKITN